MLSMEVAVNSLIVYFIIILWQMISILLQGAQLAPRLRIGTVCLEAIAGYGRRWLACPSRDPAHDPQ